MKLVLSLICWMLFLSGAQSVRAEVIYWPTALELAKQRAASVSCLNNLWNILFAAQGWSYDHGDQFPQNFHTFSNYLSSPAPLFCPADLSRPPITNWNNFDWSGVAYQWSAQPNWFNPDAVCCRCRIHENVAVVGGYVLQTNSFKPGWPAIIAPPIAQDATPGSNIRFEVKIAPNAAQPVSYQWRREQLYFTTNITFVNDTNGGHFVSNVASAFTITNIVGQTNPVYMINAAQTNSSDYYSVGLSNSMGLTASFEVRLRVDPTNAMMATSDYWSAATCLNNLRALHLFAQIWSFEHQDHFPQTIGQMTNSYGIPMFGWPNVLFCRADKSRTAPVDWTGFDFANTSYELLPGEDQDYERVLFRCKVHGLYSLADGTVPSAPMLLRVRRLNGNATELTLLLLSNKTNVLETSSNLLDWTVLSNYTGVTGNFLCYETNSASHRFYRMRLP